MGERKCGEEKNRSRQVNRTREHKVPVWDLVRQTRDLKELKLGASPRALIRLYKACKAKALVEGRDYVIPDDVKHLTEPVLSHRMLLSRESEIEALRISDVLHEMVDGTPISGMRQAGSTK